MTKQDLESLITMEYLKIDLDMAMSAYQLKNDRIRKYLDVYDDKHSSLSNPNTVLTIDKQSKYRSYLFKKACAKLIPEISVPLTSPSYLFSLDRVGQSNEMDNNRENIAEELLNFHWNNSLDKRKLVSNAASRFAKEGTAILKVGWDIDIQRKEIEVKKIHYSVDKQEIQDALAKAEKLDDNGATLMSMQQIYESEGKMPIGFNVEKEHHNIVNSNKPQVKVVNNFGFIVDPNCGNDLKKANFVIEPYEVTLSTLRANKTRYFNLDKLEKEIQDDNVDPILSEIKNLERDNDIAQENVWTHSKNRTSVVMYEYWGYADIKKDGNIVSFVASWVGDTLIRLEENPFPHKKIPYVMASYEDVEDSPFGESRALLAAFDQAGSTMTHRAMQNIAVKNTEQQDFIDQNFLPDITQRNNYKNGRPVYFNSRGLNNPKDGFFTRTSEPVPNVLFDMKQIYEDGVSISAGVNLGKQEYIQDGFGANVPVDAINDEKLAILGRFVGLFEDMAKLILPLNARYSFEKDTYKNRAGEWKKINNLHHLTGNFHCSIEVITPEMRLAKANRLMSLMRARGQNMSEDVQSVYHHRIAQLLDESVLADEILNLTINREPTEFEKEMQQLDIDIRKAELAQLDADAKFNIGRYEENISRAMERRNDIESGVSQSLTELNLKKAELAESERRMYEAKTNLFNTEFEYKSSGQERENKEIDDQFQHLANLEREEIRTKRELSLLKKKDANKDGIVSKEESKNYLIDLIRDKTLANDKYDEAQHVMRNIDTMDF